MEDFLESLGRIIKGIAIFIGIFLLAMFFIKGAVWIDAKILHRLFLVMGIVLILDILIVLPLGIFKKTKMASAIGLIVSSYVYGLTLWFWALNITYIIWGALAVFIGIFVAGVGVVPMAMLATAIKGDWAITGQLVLLLVFTYGSRMLGFYLAQRADELTY